MSISAGDIVVELTIDDKDFKVKVKDAGTLLRSMSGSFDQTARSVKRLEDAQLSLSRKFRDLVLTLGNLRFVAMDVNDIFLKLPMSILKTAGDLERLQQLFTGLSKEMTEAGRQAEGAANFRFITDLAQKAPFAIQSLADSFVKLKTGGIEPTRRAAEILTDSVAKFGGTGETMKRAAVALQQMSGKGVVSMEELRQQLGEAIPQAMEAMAVGAGVTVAKLTDAVSKGTVSAKESIAQMLMVLDLRNAGSAEEMMKTWTGVVANLQTQWALAAKAIADAGFMDQAKEAVKEISAMLGTLDFRRFGASFGEGLGQAVQVLMSVAKAGIEWAGAIKMAAAALLIYKANTAFLIPALSGAAGGFARVSQAIRESVTAAKDRIATDRALAQQEASQALYRAEQRQAELAAFVKKTQDELHAVRVRNAQIIAEDAAMRAQLAATERRSYVPGLMDSGARDKQRQQLQELATANAALTKRENELAAALKLSTVEYGNAQVAAAKKAQEMHRVAQGVNAASAAMSAMRAVSSTMGGIFQALGGKMLLLNAAIMAGIYIWSKWGEEARLAGERAKRALQNLSNQEDLEAEGKALQAAIDKNTKAQKALAEWQGVDTSKLPATQKKLYKDLERNAMEAAGNLTAPRQRY